VATYLVYEMVSEYGIVGSWHEQDQKMAAVNCTGRYEYMCAVGIAVYMLITIL
jgi:hypothetical protein